MIDPLWYEALPDDVWTWYERVKAKSSDIVSLTVRVKRGQLSLDYLDLEGKPRRAKFYICARQSKDKSGTECGKYDEIRHF